MKKTLLVPALLASSLLLAQDYNYEVTPVVGYNIPEGNLNLKDQLVFGGELQFNNLGMPLSPELSALYTEVDSNPVAYGKVKIARVALNGVYEYSKVAFLTPFAKAGLGYEAMSSNNKKLSGNEDGAYFDAGVGAKMPLTKNIALKLEAIYMLKPNGTRWDNNLAALAGLNIAFGEHAKPVAESKPVVVAPVVAKPVTAPKPIVTPKPVVTPALETKKVTPVVVKAPVVVAAPVVPAAVVVAKSNTVAVVDGDNDQDGVKNSIDKCPTTPKGAKVNNDGCQEIVNLHVNFETNSYKIDQKSDANVVAFAAFMKLNPEYATEITGHTDNIGKPAKNLALSAKRANIVKDALVKQGVAASRIKTAGMGQTAPVASNKTAQGRSENRRIEAKLIK